MRQIISISLPHEEVKFITQQVKKRGFSSKSDYFRHLVNLEQNMITETDLVEIAKEARAEHAGGKTKVLTSLRDLVE